MSPRPEASAPHCVLIAFYFPPARASGVFRARALANHLAGAGWRTTVVTADVRFFRDVLDQVDTGLLNSLHRSVEVLRVPFDDRRFDRRLRFHGRFRGNFPKLAEQRLAARAQRRFPDPYAMWIDPTVAAVQRLVEAQGIDVVLATGNPFSAFEVARSVGESHNVPYVLDYRDAWTLDQFAGVEAFPPDAPVWDAERAVLGGASKIVFVNSAQERWYADRYPMSAGRMVVIENGFDPELLGLSAHSGRSSGPLRLGYVGTITRHLPWAELFRTWGIVASRGLLADASIELFGHLGFFAESRDAVAALLAPGEEGGRVRYRGPLTKAEVGETYRNLDILLLVTPSSPYVTCQKVYEYMAFGKPVVSVNEPGADARGPLQGYPLSFEPDSLEEKDLGEAIERAACASVHLRAQDAAAARSFAARFARVERMREYESLLESVCRA